MVVDGPFVVRERFSNEIRQRFSTKISVCRHRKQRKNLQFSSSSSQFKEGN